MAAAAGVPSERVTETGGAGGGGAAAGEGEPNERADATGGALNEAARLLFSSSSACFLANAWRSLQVNFFPAAKKLKSRVTKSGD